MIKLMGSLAAAACLMTAAAPATAQAFNGADKIARGDYAAAEHELLGRQALYPDSVDVLLNLGAVYAATGRDIAARRAYLRVVGQPDTEVVLRNGASVWSHALAERGLARQGALVATR